MLSISSNDTISSYLRRNCKTVPDQIAIDSGNGNYYSYEYVTELTKKFAKILKKNCKSGDVIVLIVDEGVPQIISQLGVKECRCVFCPFDVTFPELKVKSMAEEINATVIISMQPLPYAISDSIVNLTYEELINSSVQSTIENDSCLDTENAICYIQHTSGSSGKPKPCPCLEKEIILYSSNRCSHEGIQSTSRVLSASNSVFDPSQGDLVSVLVSASTIVAPGRQFLLHEVSEIISHSRVTHLCTTPSMLSLISLQFHYSGLKVISVGGEQSPTQLVHNWLSYDKGNNSVRIVNVYGLTEECVYQSRFEFFIDKKIEVNCIGKPDSNHSFTLNDDGILFVNKTCTGDFCEVIDTNGSVSYHLKGRKDNQIKLNGVRIAPEEIELFLNNHPLINNSVVYKYCNQLVAAVEFHETCQSVVSPVLYSGISYLLRQFLKKFLQPQLIPTAFNVFDSSVGLPIGPTGKVNRLEIQKQSISDISETDTEGPELSTPLQQMIASVWGSVLELSSNKSLHQLSDWNSLGGTSLTAVLAVRKLRFLVEGGGGGTNWPAHKTTEANGDASLYLHTSGLFTSSSNSSNNGAALLVGGDAECFMGMCDGGTFAPCKLSELGTIKQYSDFLHDNGVKVPHSTGDSDSVIDIHKQVFARFNQKELLRCLLIEETETSPSIERPRKGVTPLHVAAGEGHLEVVKMLLTEFNFSPTMTTGRGGMAVHFAAAAGKFEVLSFLLQHTPVTVRDKGRQSILHYAVRSGQTNSVQLILKSDKSLLDSRDKQFRSPLHWAVLHSHVEIVKILIKEGATIDYPPIPPIKASRSTRKPAYSPGELAIQQIVKQQESNKLHDCLAILLLLLDNGSLKKYPISSSLEQERKQVSHIIKDFSEFNHIMLEGGIEK